MINYQSISSKWINCFIFSLIFSLLFSHGVSESTASAMKNANFFDYVFFGAEHMITGYDHILFLIGVLFFLSSYLDIIKFITAFTIGHSITLVFATYFGVAANSYLIDAIIAFSVIYKGFENVGGFEKIFLVKTPSLIVMVFVFGLIHGFGLSTKLQEVHLNQSINLSQIISFNFGVEIGQIGLLIIIFPILSLFRSDSFKKINIISNLILIISGSILMVYQLIYYYIDIDSNRQENHEHVDFEIKSIDNEIRLNNNKDSDSHYHKHDKNSDSHYHKHD
mgnify:CR=1 FL=1